MTAIASMIITSNSKAKLSGAYVGVNYVNAYNDSVTNTVFRGTSAVGNISANTVGGGVEVGYNYNIDNITFNYNLNYPIKLNLEELGFKLKEITEPTYKITNNNSVFTPEEFKLREDLQDKKHYYKIYSAGNLIYSYNKSKENQKKNERH